MLRKFLCLWFLIASFSLSASGVEDKLSITNIWEDDFPKNSGVITSIDKDPASDKWHKESQAKIKKMDEKFHPKHLGRGSPNLAFLNLQLKTETETETETETISINFEDIVFISGKSIKVSPSGEKPSWDFGVIKDFDDNVYNLTLNYAPKKSNAMENNVKEVIRKNSFLTRYDEKTKNELICIEDFYPDIEEYRREGLIKYFDLKTTLGQNFGVMETKFSKFLKDFCTGNEEISTSAMKKLTSKVPVLYKKSLAYALFTKESLENLKMIFPSMEENKKDSDLLNVEVNFCDTEQSIRLFLSTPFGSMIMKPEKKEKLETSFYNALKDKKKSLKKLQSITVNIASRRYMCNYCLGTYEYDLSEKNSIKNGIIKKLSYCIYTLNFLKNKEDELNNFCNSLTDNHMKDIRTSDLKKEIKGEKNTLKMFELFDKELEKNKKQSEIIDKISKLSEAKTKMEQSRAKFEKNLKDVKIEVFVSGSVKHYKK